MAVGLALQGPWRKLRDAWNKETEAGRNAYGMI